MAQRRYFRQIIIRYIMFPKEEDNDAELEWVFKCLGLGDDADEVGKSIFRALVRSAKKGEGISSRELMEDIPVTQAAIVYHLNNFMRSGLVVKHGRSYMLRGGSLQHALDEIENDMVRRMGQLKEIAKKIEEGS